MKTEGQAYFRNYNRCPKFKSKPHRVEIYSIHASYPVELIHLGHLTIELGKGRKAVNILIITGLCTRYAQAIATMSQTAKLMAQALWDKFIMLYRLPESVLSEQGRNFESVLVVKPSKLAQIK